jgi:chromosome segregation ATPase
MRPLNRPPAKRQVKQDNKEITMRTNGKILLLTGLLSVTFLLSGCAAPQWPTEVVLQPAQGSAARQSPSAAKRFQDVSKGSTVLESAMELSEKYSTLLEETAKLRMENQKFSEENKSLKEQLTSCQSQLERTQKELAEATDLLTEMRVELNNWKNDILGFRGEMREAQKAQLEALLKILNILGTDTKAESAKTSEPNSAPTHQNVPDNLNNKKP